MRKIILTIIAVILGITYGYAESCSCGQGCLSYQISGCGEESRACCSGTWCAWGVTSCASCTDTTTPCSSIGTYTSGTATRSVTGSCGTCSYSAWDTSACVQCSSEQCWNGSSCVSPEATSRNCSGNVSGACAGTQTRTKTCVAGSGWSYGAWTGNCTMTQSCTQSYADPKMPCTNIKNYIIDSGINTNYCSGTVYASFTLRNNCGSCTYSLSGYGGQCRCCSSLWRTIEYNRGTLEDCNTNRSNSIASYNTNKLFNSSCDYRYQGMYKTGSETACTANANGGYTWSIQICACSDF